VTARHQSSSYRIAVGLVRPVLSAITRRDWRGAQYLPVEGGFVVCANHLSYADPFTFAHFLHEHGCPPRFLAKEAVFEIPVLGRIIAGAGQIPVRRESKDAGRAFDDAVRAVAAGECVAVFPEATLTRDPGLWPMIGKTGAARIALTTGCPVIPVAQWGMQEILAPYARIPHLLPRHQVHVWAGPAVNLSAWGGGGPPDATALRQATDAILDDITALLAQIRGEQPPEQRWDPREHDQPRIGDFRRAARPGRTGSRRRPPWRQRPLDGPGRRDGDPTRQAG
jgi:1-acyl-sn-glycerol-3-phosphate acyltransferase